MSAGEGERVGEDEREDVREDEREDVRGHVGEDLREGLLGEPLLPERAPEGSEASPLPPLGSPEAKRRQLALSLERTPELRASASAELADEVMRGVLNGEWAIADHFEGEARRFVIVRRRRQGAGRALSEREREVLALAVQGHSNKVIAYELGLTPSTVATHLRRMMDKLHLASREALIQVFPYELAVDAAGDEEES